MGEPYDSTADTVEHIGKVQDYLYDAMKNLSRRSLVHDQSKLKPPEKDAFDALTPRLKGLTYGSDEYRACLKEMKPALDHHYANNSHHPEHNTDGISGMSLFDIVEMLMDWKAASERHADGDIWTSISHNVKRFGLSPQLDDILCNTAREMGW